MGKTIRHAAVALLAFLHLIGLGSVSAIEMTKVDLTTTSGTLLLQRMFSEEAVLSQDGTHVFAKQISLTMRIGRDQMVRAEAPEGLVIVGGREMAKRPTAEIPYRDILSYNSNFENAAAPGDILLDGKGKPTVASIGDTGKLSSEKLVWSDRYERFIIPAIFSQEGAVGSDGRMTVTGSAMATDQSFMQWTYYTDGKTAAVITLERPASPAAGKDGKDK